jgi:hypothetical protein
MGEGGEGGGERRSSAGGGERRTSAEGSQDSDLVSTLNLGMVLNLIGGMESWESVSFLGISNFRAKGGRERRTGLPESIETDARTKAQTCSPCVEPGFRSGFRRERVSRLTPQLVGKAESDKPV